MARFDWAQLLRLGLVRLRLSPADFWALSPAELMVMLGPEGQARPMSSDGLEALLKAYPDTEKENSNG